MDTKPQNRTSVIALIVSLVALIVTLFAGIIYVLIGMGSFTPDNPDTYRLILEISAAVTVLGVAVYAILEPESVRTFLTGRQARYSSNAFVTILAFAGIVFIANYVMDTNSKLKDATDWDLTENKVNTLSPELTSAMENLPGEMMATGYFSQSPEDTARQLFEKMKAASNGKFDYRFIDPVVDPLAAKAAGVTGDGKIVLEMNGRSEIAAYADEAEILTAMNRLLNPQARTVYFLVGHGERDINGADENAYSRARDTLEKKNITVKTLNLVAENVIPADAKAIIIAGPVKPITPNESSLLNNYALHGGSLVVLEDPIPLTEFGETPDPLSAFLDNVWGLRLRNDFVVDTASQSVQNAVGAVFDSGNPISSTMTQVTIMPLTRSIEIIARDGFTQTALAQTSTTSTSWGETDFTPLQGSSTAIGFDSATDTAGPLVIVASSENASGGKVVVVGSSTFATDAGFDAYGNGDLFVNAVSWAAGQGKTYDVTPKDVTQRTFNPPSQVASLAILLGSVCGIPAIIIGLGIYAWASRRRRGEVMVKRSTWILMAIFVVFAGIALYLQRSEKTPSALPAEGTSSPVPTTGYLFPAEEGVVTSLLLESRDGDMLGFERQGDAWVLTKPYYAETIAGSVEAAASQVTALPIEKSLDLDVSAVGLNSPAYTITVGYSSGRFLVVQIGDETPTGSGYYVRKESGPVLVVSKYNLASLLDMLTTPPLVETPTPSPAPPTETPTITPTSALTETGTPPTATKAP